MRTLRGNERISVKANKYETIYHKASVINTEKKDDYESIYYFNIFKIQMIFFNSFLGIKLADEVVTGSFKSSPLSSFSNVVSPSPNRKMKALALASPSVKRKLQDASEDKSNKSKLIKKSNIDKSLSEELVVLFYSKKHKEKMPSLVEQTFVYRRSIIENNNGAFLDLLDQFKYLTDTKNVNYFLDFNLSI